MITSHLLTNQQRYEVAYHLNKMEGPERVADLTGVPLDTVRELAHSVGWPANEKRMQWSVNQLAMKPDVTPIVDDSPEPDTSDPDAGFEVFEKPSSVVAGSPVPLRVATTDGQAPTPGAPGRGRRELIKVADLDPDPDNPRDPGMVDEDIDALADSIKQVGLLQDIVARRDGDRVVVVAGHRRLQAVRSLGWEHVHVLVHDAMSRDQVLAAMLTENSHRKDLDPLLQARAIEQLRQAMGGTGISHMALAKRLGRSQVWVSARLSLLALNRDDQEKVRRGDMRLDEAIRTARLEAGTARGKQAPRLHFSNGQRLASTTRRGGRTMHNNHEATSVATSFVVDPRGQVWIDGNRLGFHIGTDISVRSQGAVRVVTIDLLVDGPIDIRCGRASEKAEL